MPLSEKYRAQCCDLWSGCRPLESNRADIERCVCWDGNQESLRGECESVGFSGHLNSTDVFAVFQVHPMLPFLLLTVLAASLRSTPQLARFSAWRCFGRLVSREETRAQTKQTWSHFLSSPSGPKKHPRLEQEEQDIRICLKWATWPPSGCSQPMGVRVFFLFFWRGGGFQSTHLSLVALSGCPGKPGSYLGLLSHLIGRTAKRQV